MITLILWSEYNKPRKDSTNSEKQDSQLLKNDTNKITRPSPTITATNLVENPSPEEHEQKNNGRELSIDKLEKRNYAKLYRELDLKNGNEISSLYRNMIKDSSQEIYTILVNDIKENGTIKAAITDDIQDWVHTIRQGHAALAFSIETTEQFEHVFDLLLSRLGQDDQKFSNSTTIMLRKNLIEALGSAGNPQMFSSYLKLTTLHGDLFNPYIATACMRYDWVTKNYKHFPAIKDPREGFINPSKLIDAHEEMDFYIKWKKSYNEENGLMSDEVKTFLKKSKLYE